MRTRCARPYCLPLLACLTRPHLQNICPDKFGAFSTFSESQSSPLLCASLRTAY